jgi:hypothetical protein
MVPVIHDGVYELSKVELNLLDGQQQFVRNVRSTFGRAMASWGLPNRTRCRAQLTSWSNPLTSASFGDTLNVESKYYERLLHLHSWARGADSTNEGRLRSIEDLQHVARPLVLDDFRIEDTSFYQPGQCHDD